MKYLLPKGWPRPSGYSNGVLAKGQQVFVAGMVGWDENGTFAEGLVEQFEKVLQNTVAVLQEAGAGPEHVVRMTWFVKDLDTYRQNLVPIGLTYRKVMGKSFPAMAAIGINDLVEPEALIEIETTAVIPDDE
ncbi:MAG: RidA family protein [Gammaproteobacteria bacterium]|nr:RidA family protein [Gammaproteobacteria bacterium]